MSLVLGCGSCGSDLQIPEQLAADGKTFRCPKCKTIVPAAVVAQALGTPNGVKPASAKPAAVRERSSSSVSSAIQPVRASSSGRSARRHGTREIEYDELEVLPDDHPLDEPAPRRGMPRLLKPQRFLIKGKSNVFSTMLDYNIFDMDTRRQVGVAIEEPETWAAILKFFMRRRYLPTRFEFRDQRSDRLVFTLQRPAFFWLPRVEVYDGEERLIGYFSKNVFSMSTFQVFDWRDREFAEVSWSRKPSLTMRFRSKDGRELGNVTHECVATGKVVVSWFTEGGSYVVTAAPDMKDQPEAKMLLLGTAVAVDIFHSASFENWDNKRVGNRGF
jgi:hypothetical protein